MAVVGGFGGGGGGRSTSSPGVGGTSNWWTNTFNPTKAEQTYNAYQASLDRQFAFDQTLRSQAYNSTEAQKQRDFEERMSNTAYSRAISQLRENGLNPYLAITGGMSASTPSGSAASSSAYTASGARSGGRVGASESVIGSLASSAFRLGAEYLMK